MALTRLLDTVLCSDEIVQTLFQSDRCSQHDRHGGTQYNKGGVTHLSVKSLENGIREIGGLRPAEEFQSEN